jgi:hypothetical protein
MASLSLTGPSRSSPRSGGSADVLNAVTTALAHRSKSQGRDTTWMHSVRGLTAQPLYHAAATQLGWLMPTAAPSSLLGGHSLVLNAGSLI